MGTMKLSARVVDEMRLGFEIIRLLETAKQHLCFPHRLA